MKPKPWMKTKVLAAIIVCWAAFPVAAQNDSPEAMFKHIFPAVGAPARPKVPVVWNRFNDVQGLYDILNRIQAAYPELCSVEVIGQSHEGRPIMAMTLTDPSGGPAKDKPGFYIDGNIHGNEVQGGEAVVYTAWWLCEQHGRVPEVQRLLRERVFYLLPTINPDGRDDWFHAHHEIHNQHTSRGGKMPRDDDRDGVMDEDGPEDLNGDGHITQMRRANPSGRWVTHPDWPDVMREAKSGQPGAYDLWWQEGYDNDHDGEINEDEVGGYDPNRNWPWDWQPRYVQGGSHDAPGSLPETRAVMEYVIARPNIAGMQSYHNAGGMILRPPGREGGRVYDEDESMLRRIGERGSEIAPFYSNWVVWKDLYTVWGGEFDWFYGARGIAGYTNEMWTRANMERRVEPKDGDADAEERRFAKDLLFDEPVVPWTKVQHPTLGEIEVGGYVKEFGRVPPAFLLEEELHRNMATTLYHADQMPRLAFGNVSAKSLGNGRWQLDVEVRNSRQMATRLAVERERNFGRPDIASLDYTDRVIAGGQLTGDEQLSTFKPVRYRPHRLAVSHVPGLGSVMLRWVIQGDQPITIVYDSAKGGRIERTIDLVAPAPESPAPSS